ncbi:MAG: hypothetical protein HFJ79_11275 [Clostridiales bacterium]|jgi:hypothetical protein|nr:hypothetical protein [Clostridiales bacterium]
MALTPIQSFFALFYILDYCFQWDQDDDLGAFLGMISPDIWTNGEPSDIAVYKDWVEYTQSKKIDTGSLPNGISDFLGIYMEQYGFNFYHILQLLPEKISPREIQNAINKSHDLCENKGYLTADWV